MIHTSCIESNRSNHLVYLFADLLLKVVEYALKKNRTKSSKPRCEQNSLSRLSFLQQPATIGYECTFYSYKISVNYSDLFVMVHPSIHPIYYIIEKSPLYLYHLSSRPETCQLI